MKAGMRKRGEEQSFNLQVLSSTPASQSSAQVVTLIQLLSCSGSTLKPERLHISSVLTREQPCSNLKALHSKRHTALLPLPSPRLPARCTAEPSLPQTVGRGGKDKQTEQQAWCSMENKELTQILW